MRRSARRVAVVLFAALVVAVLGATPPARQAAAQPRAVPLDIVLAVDQSGSMGQSDPNNRRIEAVTQFVDTLAAFQDAYEARVGVVEFGSPAIRSGSTLRPTLGLTAPQDPAVKGALRPDTLAGTDFKGALCLAWATATGARPPQDAGCPTLPEVKPPQTQPRGEGPRERIVVLLTDGFPAPDGCDLRFPEGNRQPACPLGPFGNDYFRELQQLWESLNRAQATRLYVIGLDENDVWFPTAAPYWVATTGCDSEVECQRAVRRSPNPDSLISDVIESAIDALVDLCGRSGAQSECQLPGLLAEVQFVIDGLRTGTGVRIVAPDGSERQPGPSVQYTIEGDRQRWRVRAPARGVWRVDSLDADAQLAVTQVAIPAQFDVRPIPEQPIAQAALSLQLLPTGTSQIDLASAAGETVELEAQRNGQAAITRQVTLERAGTGLRISNALAAAEEGQWRFRVITAFGDRRVVIGEGSVNVVAQPSPSPTPVPTQTPAGPPSNECPEPFTSTISPGGPEVSAYRWAFKLGWPTHFHKPATIGGEVEGCTPVSVPLNVQLRLTPDGGDRAGEAVVWKGTGTGTALVEGEVDDEIRSWSTLRRSLIYESPTGPQELEGDVVQLTTPGYVSFEQSTGFGYWWWLFPLLAIMLLVAFLSTLQVGPAGVRLSNTAVWNQRRRNSEPITQCRLFIWRSVELGGTRSRGTLSLRYIFAGPLVLRETVAPPSRHGGRLARNAKRPSILEQLSAWWRRQTPMLLGSTERVQQVRLVPR
ncbi:MAG: vWA domain-containing protein [Dehalococcoidia bacterium]